MMMRELLTILALLCIGFVLILGASTARSDDALIIIEPTGGWTQTSASSATIERLAALGQLSPDNRATRADHAAACTWATTQPPDVLPAEPSEVDKLKAALVEKGIITEADIAAAAQLLTVKK